MSLKSEGTKGKEIHPILLSITTSHLISTAATMVVKVGPHSQPPTKKILIQYKMARSGIC